MHVGVTGAVLCLLVAASVGCRSSGAAHVAATLSPVLVTPSPPPVTSTCLQDQLVAETTTAATTLTDFCFGRTLVVVPRIPVDLGSVVVIAGLLAQTARFSLPDHQDVVRLQGTTFHALRPGNVTVSVTGVPCGVAEGEPPTSCPLLTIVVEPAS
jgi:hypothetical protein